MANSLFKYIPFQGEAGHERDRPGDVALPDIQRPFVWPTAKVRDLLDSMFRGFPVGYLLFWATGAELGRAADRRRRDKTVPGAILIVDGQQRLTRLYSVFTGHRSCARTTPSHGSGSRSTRARAVRGPDAAIEKDPSSSRHHAAVEGLPRRPSKATRAAGAEPRDLTSRSASDARGRFDRVRDLQAYPSRWSSWTPPRTRSRSPRCSSASTPKASRSTRPTSSSR